jgi:hypothetical protein
MAHAPALREMVRRSLPRLADLTPSVLKQRPVLWDPNQRQTK